ncbi:class I SAM-dependent methyltransferase [Phenylobacterium sp.]|jgi:SAM-dependent methyltransferase|uniref:class I SAM-dependent methyltransferase n=1 Tax=Phenylobacterium sp. TaxID=1871053 RepID=UPI002F41262F
MPVSAPVFDQHIAALIQRMAPDSVLDIGPGAGKYGRIVGQLRAAGLAVGSLTAVEIDPSYIEQFRLAELYDFVQQGDACLLPDVSPDAFWDLVILGDVLEHFRKSRGVDLIDYLYYRTKYIVLVVPIDYPQGAWQGHAAEAHISTWYPADFARYKASGFSSVAPSTGNEIQLVLINGLRADPAADFIFARDLAASGVFAGPFAPA